VWEAENICFCYRSAEVLPWLITYIFVSSLNINQFLTYGISMDGHYWLFKLWFFSYLIMNMTVPYISLISEASLSPFGPMIYKNRIEIWCIYSEIFNLKPSMTYMYMFVYIYIPDRPINNAPSHSILSRIAKIFLFRFLGRISS
jgi:hypothetical protein